MQNILSQLQNILSKHYGYVSELDLKPLVTFQSLLHEPYDSDLKILSIPLWEPKRSRPIAFLKVKNVDSPDASLVERLQDLVQVTLQSYIDLIDKMDVAENLMQYLEVEMNPEKVIRFQKTSPQKIIHTGKIPLKKDHAFKLDQQDLLLYSSQPQLLDQLAVHLHHCAEHQFFIRSDHMPAHFLSSLNDLAGLEKTTLYIPRLEKLTSVQQKGLMTHLLMEKKQSLLIVAGTCQPVQELIDDSKISRELLKHFHLFHMMSEGREEQQMSFETLHQCAATILGLQTKNNMSVIKSDIQVTKSYNLIPSLQNFFPTVH